MATLFEVHTLKGGTWQIESTYPDREAAIEVAKQLHKEKTYTSIKVIKDVFDPKTNQGKEVVVYDTSKPPPEKKAPPPKEEPKAAAPEKKADVDFKGGKPKALKSEASTALVAVGWLALILVGGIGILFGLYKLSDLLR
jgi:hypothetical protein